ncbi:MAG: PadR family transcriptional regulator [Verrucomicrobiota bacterium]|jgi:PadR family transcriptional regulator, regulatory protein PadR|nr:PadR family transcriptional regulator [Verrucomicrobiota bacterium]
MSQSKELVAASSTPMVLSILNRGESYGYAIIQELRDLSDSEIQWTDGMLYPVLRRLEKQGFIRSDWRVGDSGKRRRYYRIEKSGSEQLQKHKQQWNMTHAVMVKLWEGMPCSI